MYIYFRCHKETTHIRGFNSGKEKQFLLRKVLCYLVVDDK